MPLKAFACSIKKTKTALPVYIFLVESDDTIPSKQSGTRIGENTRRAFRQKRAIAAMAVLLASFLNTRQEVSLSVEHSPRNMHKVIFRKNIRFPII